MVATALVLVLAVVVLLALITRFGRSAPIEPGPKRPRAVVKRNYLWPNVGTVEGAEWAIRQAFWTAVWVAGITALFALPATFGVRPVAQVDAWTFVDATLFGAIAIGLWRRSRFAAWSGLLIFAVNRIYLWVEIGPRAAMGGVTFVFLLGFLGGVRGATALHRFKAEGDQTSMVSPEQQKTETKTAHHPIEPE